MSSPQDAEGGWKPKLNGFPPGYFLIRSLANDRLLDVAQDKVADGTPVMLWPEKESSLVESLRRPEADNQIFFIDNSTGALSSKLAGHAIDVQDDRLVVRHRRPVMQPYPSARSHPLPTFSFAPKTGRITVTFAADPAVHSIDPCFALTAARTGSAHVLAALPRARPPGLFERTSAFFGAVTAPRVPDIDLAEAEVLESELDEAAEADDDPDPARDVRVICVDDGVPVGAQAAVRRRWEVVPLRQKRAMTGSM